MGLIFSLIDVASAQEVPFGIPQYIQYILHGQLVSYVQLIHSSTKNCLKSTSVIKVATMEKMDDFHYTKSTFSLSARMNGTLLSK